MESGVRIRALMLCGVAVTAVAAPAAAQLPPVPTVHVPPVPTVQLPPVPSVVPTAVPTVTPPQVPALPGVGGGGQAPSGGGGSAGAGTTGGGGSSGGGATGAGGSSGGGSSSGGGPSAPSGGGGTSSGRSASSSGSGAAGRVTSTRPSAPGTGRRGSPAPSTHTVAARRDRKLRKAVLARRSCLGSLSRGERIVLTLRAGVGRTAPRSRGAVAQRLRITIRRVTRLEHAGLKRLRAVCGASAPAVATTDSATPPAPGSTLAQAPARPDAKARAHTPSRTATPAPSTEAEEPPQGGVAGRSATNVPAPSDGTFPLWIPLLFAACGAAGYFASRLRPARAAAAPPPASAQEHWSTPPAGGVEPPPAPAPPAAAPPPAEEPLPELPQHRAPSRHRH